MSSNNIYKKYHHTYWITNTKLNKHYIGVRSCNNHPIKDLGIKYFSSSLDKEFKKDQKEQPELYDYKITGIFSLRELALEDEIFQHELYNVAKNLRFYNNAKQRENGFDRAGLHYFLTEKTKKKMSLATNGKTNSNYKGVIQQYDLTGKFIREADSWEFKELGFNLSGIYNCINHPEDRITSQGFTWRREVCIIYVEDASNLKRGKKHPYYKGYIKQIDKNTNKVIREADSWEFKELGFNISSISNCINHPECNKTHKGFIWRRENNL